MCKHLIAWDERGARWQLGFAQLFSSQRPNHRRQAGARGTNPAQTRSRKRAGGCFAVHRPMRGWRLCGPRSTHGTAQRGEEEEDREEDREDPAAPGQGREPSVKPLKHCIGRDHPTDPFVGFFPTDASWVVWNEFTTNPGLGKTVSGGSSSFLETPKPRKPTCLFS